MPMFGDEISQYTWANKPSVAPLGQIICVTDVGENGSLWRGNGTKWVRLHCIHFYNLPAAVVVTGTTAEVTLTTISIPAGLMGANGKIKFYPIWTTTNNANAKTLRVKHGGVTRYAGDSIGAIHNTGLLILQNFNSESVQKMSSGMVAGLGGTIRWMTQGTTDTTVSTTIEISGQLAVGTDTMTLESLFLELV